MSRYAFNDMAKEININRYDTPTPWLNYLSNGTFHAMISQAGGGLAFYKSPQIWRINHYRFFNLPTDRSGFYTYIKDNDTVFCPTNEPFKDKPDEWCCNHGMGYTEFKSKKKGLSANAKYFIGKYENCLIYELKLNSDTDRKITVFPYIELGMMEYMREIQWQCYNKHQLTVYNLDKDVLVYKYGVENQPKPDETPLIYFACDVPISGFDGDRDEFIGAYRSEENPLRVEEGKCSNSTMMGGDPCFAMQIDLLLKANEEKTIHIFLGSAENDDDIRRAVKNCRVADFTEKSFEALNEQWNGFLDKFSCEIPDKDAERMINIWNPYQAERNFQFSRNISYYATGTFRGVGYRDTSQDVLAIIPFDTDRAKEKIKLLLSQQYGEPQMQIRLRYYEDGVVGGGKDKDLAGGHCAFGLVSIGETEEDWNCSWMYMFGGVKAEAIKDGKIKCYIQIQINGKNDPLPEISIDDLTIVKVTGEEGNYIFHDLDGNLVDPEEFAGVKTDNKDDENNDDYDNEDDNVNDNENDNVNDNTGTGNGSNVGSNTGSGTGSNTDSSNSGSNNYNNNNYNTGTGVNSGFVVSDTIDITEAMEQIDKLNAGDAVDFINLFRLTSDNGGIDAYVSVETLSAKELDALKAMTKDELEDIAITLRAILSTMNNNPNMDNAKAFTKFGGNTAKTLPLSFVGNINLPFTTNIRIKMGAGTLSANDTYYAYLCDAYTREISNLGKVYMEEDDDGNVYATIRTNKFADFFITEDNLKPTNKADTDADTDNNNGISTVWIIVIIVAAVLLLSALAVIIIIIAKKRR